MKASVPIKLRARHHDLGGIPVNRVLPERQCRAVGPFVFFDHFGPAEADMQVAPHPHIGLSTLTWLFSGSVRHRDSLGNDQIIKPGEVNWMTAGRGVVHSERARRDPGAPLHGIQCWVAQTVEHEQGEPEFAHLGADELPRFSQEGIEWTLAVGHWQEEHSPLAINWPAFFVQGRVVAPGRWQWWYPACWALGVYVISGHLSVHWHDGSITALNAGEMAAFPPPEDEAHPEITANEGT
ncbi:MAG: pirin family protein, partial [Natronospirillum sp.]